MIIEVSFYTDDKAIMDLLQCVIKNLSMIISFCFCYKAERNLSKKLKAIIFLILPDKMFFLTSDILCLKYILPFKKYFSLSSLFFLALNKLKPEKNARIVALLDKTFL